MHHVCLERELLSAKLRDTRDCKAEDRGPAHCDAIQGPVVAKSMQHLSLDVYKNDNFCKKKVFIYVHETLISAAPPVGWRKRVPWTRLTSAESCSAGGGILTIMLGWSA